MKAEIDIKVSYGYTHVPKRVWYKLEVKGIGGIHHSGLIFKSADLISIKTYGLKDFVSFRNGQYDYFTGITTTGVRAKEKVTALMVEIKKQLTEALEDARLPKGKNYVITSEVNGEVIA